MKPIDNTWNRRWVGVGFKSSGHIGIAGIDSTGAFMVNLGNHENFWLRIMNAQYGPGLGGSASFVAIFAWGLIEPYDLHGMEIRDWGFNVAIAEKLPTGLLKRALTSFEDFRRLQDIRQLMDLSNVFNPTNNIFLAINRLKEKLGALFISFEASQGRGVATFELGGWGLELSTYITRGHMAVQNSSSMDLGNYR